MVVSALSTLATFSELLPLLDIRRKGVSKDWYSVILSCEDISDLALTSPSFLCGRLNLMDEQGGFGLLQRKRRG